MHTVKMSTWHTMMYISKGYSGDDDSKCDSLHNILGNANIFIVDETAITIPSSHKQTHTHTALYTLRTEKRLLIIQIHFNNIEICTIYTLSLALSNKSKVHH